MLARVAPPAGLAEPQSRRVGPDVGLGSMRSGLGIGASGALPRGGVPA